MRPVLVQRLQLLLQRLNIGIRLGRAFFELGDAALLRGAFMRRHFFLGRQLFPERFLRRLPGVFFVDQLQPERFFLSLQLVESLMALLLDVVQTLAHLHPLCADIGVLLLQMGYLRLQVLLFFGRIPFDQIELPLEGFLRGPPRALAFLQLLLEDGLAVLQRVH